MKLIVGNNLDNKDFDYHRVSDDKTLGDSLPCFGCDKSLVTIICLKCVDLVVKAIDKHNKPDGEWCKYCNNFSPMAIKNFPEAFLCFGCNTHRNRVILGLE